ncbi:DNA mismatch repair protein MutL [Candidatus Hepatincola sp. Pdp]
MATASIKILPPLLVNQIAAGEVIERPASIVKELMENAIDAESTSIEVSINNGGKTYIAVTDNGVGMNAQDLSLCLKAHATSKIIDNNLTELPFLGFRGEALASIASVAQITIASKHASEEYGNFIAAQTGIAQDIVPNSIQIGTKIQITDLFSAIPARLKFLRTDSVEASYCFKVFKKLALSNYTCNFKLIHNNKTIFTYNAINGSPIKQLQHRIAEVLGKDFIENSLYINEQNPMLKLYGFISVPTFHSNKNDNAYFIINNRHINTSFLSTIVKVAYADVLFNMKYPHYILFMDINPQEIDVNVNPTKSEVRFKDIGFIRHYLISTIKKYLQNTNNQKTNSTLGQKLVDSSFKISTPNSYNNTLWQQALSNHDPSTNATPISATNNTNTHKQTTLTLNDVQSNLVIESTQPLGYAKAQVHKNWIIAQNHHGLVIIDQHAAHERIVQEELKTKYTTNSVSTQLLLTPEIIELPTEDYNLLTEFHTPIKALGIHFEKFGKNLILINAIPAILGNIPVKPLIKDLIYDLKHLGHHQTFDEKINHIIATMACHNSIRSGRVMNEKEMNNLLRTLETTNNYAQCSHGRPTFVNISLQELEKLFNRK